MTRPTILPTSAKWYPSPTPAVAVAHRKRPTEALKEKGITLSVKKTWFDFGQGWAWTTLIARFKKLEKALAY